MANIVATPAPKVAAGAIPRRPNPVWQFICTQPLGFAGLIVILAYLVAAVGAAWIAPFDPEAIDFAAMLGAPDREHILGTDQFGRDVFSRIVYGARTALAVACSPNCSIRRFVDATNLSEISMPIAFT